QTRNFARRGAWTKSRHAGLRRSGDKVKGYAHEQRRHSSRSRDVDGKKRRLPGARICRRAHRQSFAGPGRKHRCPGLRLDHEAKKLKGGGGISEDELHDLEKQIQKLTDRFVKSIDDHFKHKETEIMKV